MTIFPIIPIYLMIVICFFLLIVSIKNKKKNILDILLIILLFIVNLRIMYKNDNSYSAENNLDVLFVIDNTISMNAEDYNNNETRLSALKEDCNYIINELNGSRFSIITFNNNAKINIPFTNDINLTKKAIEIINPISNIQAKGSSLNTPLETIIETLKSANKKNDRKKIIFFISDGEITDESTLKSYKEIKNLINNGAVLGYGTTNGGYMKEKDFLTKKEKYIMDSNGLNYEKAKSKIDEKNLKQLATDMNIDYIYMNKKSNFNKKLKEIKTSSNTTYNLSNKKAYNDTYFIFIVPLLILLLLKFKNVKESL